MALQRRIPRTRDPMATRGIERRYEVRLKRRVEAFGAACHDLLKGESPRMLETSRVPFSLDKIDNLAQFLIMQRGQQVAADELIKAFYNGQQYAMAGAKTGGIIPLTEQLSIQMMFNLPPNRETMDLLNQRNYNLIKGLSDEQAKRVKYELTEGMLAGEDARRLARRVNKVTEFGMARASTIARTETQTAAVQGAKNLYEQWGISQVEWITAKDERVCEVCGPRDGKVYDMKAAPPCPAHPNCRCALAPYNPAPGEERKPVSEPDETQIRKELPPEPEPEKNPQIMEIPIKPEAQERTSIPETRMGKTRVHVDSVEVNEKLTASSAYVKPDPLIKNYTSEGYKSVNGGLRGIVEVDPAKLKPVVDSLDSRLAKTALPEDIKVFRGASPRVADKLIASGGMYDPAYTSTTTDLPTAISIGKQGAGGFKVGANDPRLTAEYTNVLVMTRPKGSQAMAIGGPESEIILPRGMSYKVNKVVVIDDIRFDQHGVNDINEAIAEGSKVRFIYVDEV